MITFPTKIVSSALQLPPDKDVRIGDFIVARYKSSRWAKSLPWEDWHHAALISNVKPLKVIEALGPNKKGQPPGPFEVNFEESFGWGKNDGLIKMKWLRPKFPDLIREMAKKEVPRSKRKVITEEEARARAVDYAREQTGENYSIWTSKWNESQWYCSLLIYKSYSRTITDMYLEDYDDPESLRAGLMVTPEDLVDSARSEVYFSWILNRINA